MKLRNGFVSNSSSSSFVILLEDLNEKQIEQIKDHIHEGIRRSMSCSLPSEEWQIEINNKLQRLEGYTDMDNFCISDLFEMIGVDPEKVIWSE